MILKEIDTIYRKKGMKQAEDDAFDWYKQAKKDSSDGSVEFVESQMLQVGKINIFKYSPKGIETLDYYDKNPVVLSLGTFKVKNRIYEMGLNLNFIPAPYKWYLLDTIQKTYSGFFQRIKNNKNLVSANNQPQVKYSYTALKSILKQFGFEYALRVYIPSRKRKVFCVSYNSWVEVAFLSVEKFEGITYNQMITEFHSKK
jgi:hypothetical protein